MTNAVDGTMSVIDLTAATPVVVGHRDRRGRRAARHRDHAERHLRLHRRQHHAATSRWCASPTNEVVGRVKTGGNPYAVAISNDGDRNDNDERVYRHAAVRRGHRSGAPRRLRRCQAGRGRARSASATRCSNAGTATVTRLLLKPLASGFTADRRNFCPLTRDALQTAGTVVYFNSGADGTGNGAAALAKTTFCPDATSPRATSAPTARSPRVAQKVYPNMLFGALLRGPLLYVQQRRRAARAAGDLQHQRAGAGRRAEPGDQCRDAVHRESQHLRGSEGGERRRADDALDKLFLNDIVAMDADRRGKNFLVVSRGGNYVIRATLGTRRQAHHARRRQARAPLPDRQHARAAW